MGTHKGKIVIFFISTLLEINFKVILKNGQVKHFPSAKCLDVAGVANGGDVILKNCETGKETQLWQFEKYFEI